MYKTVISKKGQVVIPKPIREQLSLQPGTPLTVELKEKQIILQPLLQPPQDIFVEAGPHITEPILKEAKKTADKIEKLLEDLGIQP